MDQYGVIFWQGLSRYAGTPAEGTSAPVQPAGHRGYNIGTTPNMAPYAPSGNPSVNLSVPRQRMLTDKLFRTFRW